MDPTHHQTAGEVNIAPGAHIAAGVLLYAQPGSRIDIQAGACVGEHCIIHVSGGPLVIATGATLGSGVLVFGKGVIGARASIGEGSTLIQPDIAQEGVVPPGSLVGDRSRSVADPLLYLVPTVAVAQPVHGSTPVLELESPATLSSEQLPNPSRQQQQETPLSPPLSPTEQVRQHTNGRPVPGQATLQQLLRKIYPHRQEDSLVSTPDP